MNEITKMCSFFAGFCKYKLKSIALTRQVAVYAWCVIHELFIYNICIHQVALYALWVISDTRVAIKGRLSGALDSLGKQCDALIWIQFHPN